MARYYEDYMNKRILNRISITLRSLKTYGYIDSKIKSYWIQRRFLLLFIFLGYCAFWPYTIKSFPMLLFSHAFRPFRRFHLMGHATKFCPTSWCRVHCQYNIVAKWLFHVISLVIPFNDISLSLPTALTYCLDGSPFWYIKPHSSIIGNWLPTSYCWKALPAAIPFVGKHFHRHPTIFPFVGKQPSLIWFRWGTKSPLIALQLQADDLVII